MHIICATIILLELIIELSQYFNKLYYYVERNSSTIESLLRLHNYIWYVKNKIQLFIHKLLIES